MSDAYVVEQPAIDSLGRNGIARVYVGSEARAQELVSERPDIRSYRAVSYNEMPAAARENLKRARS